MVIFHCYVSLPEGMDEKKLVSIQVVTSKQMVNDTVNATGKTSPTVVHHRYWRLDAFVLNVPWVPTCLNLLNHGF